MRSFTILSLVAVCCGVLLSGCESPATVSQVKKADGDVVKSKAITANCIVTFYKTDGSRYLSEQEHLISPPPGGIAISAEEPGGKISCKFNGGFSRSGNVKIKDMPISLCDRSLAKAIWASVTAGCGYLGEKSGRKGERVNLEGQVYEPITMSAKSQGGEIILYKSLSDDAIEVVQVVDLEKEKVLTAKSYNYFWFEELGRRFPMKIDVFSSDKKDSEQKQIMEISYQLPIGMN